MNNLTFEVPAGGVVGFVGPNGSGKSTTIRVLLGLIEPSAGSGTVLGESIQHPESFADRVGALIEALRSWVPCRAGTICGPGRTARLARASASTKCSRSWVWPDGSDKASTYSLGMKQRLGIAAALLPDPELLVLDEPMNGLDPAGIVEIRELLKSLAAGGRTVVVSRIFSVSSRRWWTAWS